MTTTLDARSALRSRRPEWGPWLDVIEAALGDAGNPAWDAAVPSDCEGAHAPAPFLAGKRLVIDENAVRGLLRRLIEVASNGTPQMATLRVLLDERCDAMSLLHASLCQDTAPARQTALDRGADAAAFESVTHLVALPFLQACNRKWSAYASIGWREGYCPVCAAHPAFAELRGIERARVFRCGRCGGGWHARPLRCPYCGLDDHHALVSLVPEGDDSNVMIEACKSCFGYVKTYTRLQGCAPGMVMFDDLMSVHLDVAALEQGYARPQGPGYKLGVSVASGSHGNRQR